MILKRQQKEELVIKLAKEGNNTREIARAVHISLKDIGTIIRNYLGEEENSNYSGKGLSLNSKAFKLFKENKNLVEVAITLNIDTDEVLDLYNDYLRLLNLQKLMTIYKEMGTDIYLLEHLYLDLKNEDLCNKKDIFNIVQKAGKLRNLDQDLIETAGDIGRLNYVKAHLEKDLEELSRKIDDYDEILLKKSQQSSQF